MVFSDLMEKYPYRLLKGWFRAEKGSQVPELKRLLPHQLLLLLSDGSMTLDLELLFGPVGVEVRRKGACPLSTEAAMYLGEGAQKDALVREVWLTAGAKRLVYAHSLIPFDCIDEGLREDLERRSNEPLGRVLNSKKIFFSKDRLEVGSVLCAQAAMDLGGDENTPFIARRYILSNRKEDGGWVIKASVTEIFSPEIISNPFREADR